MGQVLRFDTVFKTRDFVILLFLSDSSCCSKRKRKLLITWCFSKCVFVAAHLHILLRFTFSLICQRYLGMRCWINRIHCAHISFTPPPPPLLPYSSHILYLTSKLLSKLPHHKFPAFFKPNFKQRIFYDIIYRVFF